MSRFIRCNSLFLTTKITFEPCVISLRAKNSSSFIWNRLLKLLLACCLLIRTFSEFQPGNLWIFLKSSCCSPDQLKYSIQNGLKGPLRFSRLVLDRLSVKTCLPEQGIFTYWARKQISLHWYWAATCVLRREDGGLITASWISPDSLCSTCNLQKPLLLFQSNVTFRQRCTGDFCGRSASDFLLASVLRRCWQNVMLSH